MTEMKYSQADMVRRTDSSRDMISRYVHGQCLPGDGPLAQLAQALRCKPEDLLPARGTKNISKILEPIKMTISKDNPDRVNIVCDIDTDLESGMELIKILKGYLNGWRGWFNTYTRG